MGTFFASDRRSSYWSVACSNMYEKRVIKSTYMYRTSAFITTWNVGHIVLYVRIYLLYTYDAVRKLSTGLFFGAAIHLFRLHSSLILFRCVGRPTVQGCGCWSVSQHHQQQNGGMRNHSHMTRTLRIMHCVRSICVLPRIAYRVQMSCA